jgi:hypothetical protein
VTSEKATQWATWWARQAEALRSRAIGYLTAAQRREAIEQAQFMAAYWIGRAQEAANA